MCDNAERLNRPRESKETFIKKPKKAVKEKKKRVKGTPKVPRKPKAPKTRCGGTMTESQYWAFIRAALRSKSRRWAPVYECQKAARIPYKGDNKRVKWLYICAACNGQFQQKETSIDHVLPAGSLRCGDDLAGFVERLFCEADGLQLLCHTCHAAKTARERNEP